MDTATNSILIKAGVQVEHIRITVIMKLNAKYLPDIGATLALGIIMADGLA
jgi:hypothetical protein